VLGGSCGSVHLRVALWKSEEALTKGGVGLRSLQKIILGEGLGE
jgi:hypothetical protein